MRITGERCRGLGRVPEGPPDFRRLEGLEVDTCACLPTATHPQSDLRFLWTLRRKLPPARSPIITHKVPKQNPLDYICAPLWGCIWVIYIWGCLVHPGWWGSGWRHRVSGCVLRPTQVHSPANIFPFTFGRWGDPNEASAAAGLPVQPRGPPRPGALPPAGGAVLPGGVQQRLLPELRRGLASASLCDGVPPL